MGTTVNSSTSISGGTVVASGDAVSSGSSGGGGSYAASTVDLSIYSTVHYVSTSGDDTNDGSVNTPFATVAHAISTASSTGDAIFASAGEHDVTYTGPNGFSHTGLNNDGKAVDFIGVPGGTIFKIDGVVDGTRDLHFYSGKGFSKIYNIIFDRHSGNRYVNYSNAVIGYGKVLGEFYNCVFKTFSARQGTTIYNGLVYANKTWLLPNVKFFNSTFTFGLDRSYSGQNDNVVLKDCVSTHEFHIPDARSGGVRYYDAPNGVDQLWTVLYADRVVVVDNVVQNAVLDGTYKIAFAANDVGVYSGPNSW
tara:strand:- start:375 stop:1295 length:921 start_codon:yes stop_codon:yes gene_type:complete